MPRGGKRPNAGRPSGTSAYGESTKVMRVPVSRLKEIKELLATSSPPLSIPLFSAKVSAGFPSPADDYIETYLDLNEHLIKHPAATFMVKAIGDSMIGAGISSGDILIVDRSIEPVHRKVVIAAIDGELTVKRLFLTDSQMILKAENPNYPDIEIKQDQDTTIWGVVTNVIHEVE